MDRRQPRAHAGAQRPPDPRRQPRGRRRPRRRRRGAARCISGARTGPYLDALELGNEPELYTAFAWYTPPSGKHVLGRPKGWNYADVRSATTGGSLARCRARPLAAPSIGSPGMEPESRLVPALAATRTAVATLHRYPLKRCTASTHLTAGELLAERPRRRPRRRRRRLRQGCSLTPHPTPHRRDEHDLVRRPARAQRQLRDRRCGRSTRCMRWPASASTGSTSTRSELRRTSCSVSTTWARAGVGSVDPLYYGLLMFAAGRARGVAILQRSPASSRRRPRVGDAATDGTVRTVLINDGSAAQTVRLRLTTRRQRAREQRSSGSRRRVSRRSAASRSAGRASARRRRPVVLAGTAELADARRRRAASTPSPCRPRAPRS